MSKDIYLYKIYHIPSTTWLLARADTKYNAVLELPSEFFALCSSRMGVADEGRYDNRVRLDFDDDTFTHSYCCRRSTCTKCVISNVELSPSEVVVYWSKLPSITNHLLHLLGPRPDEDSLICICMHLRRGDIELDTWTELPYKE